MTNHSMQLRWILALGVLLTRLFAGEAHKPAPPAMPVVPFEPAPVQVLYDMPMNGFVAVNIHDKATGKLVRRLVAETPHEKGKISESWDLRDEKGQPVPPGDYTFSGIARPPLKLTYELTVYNSGIPAWFAPEPAKGGGSWLADHTMGSAVATQKDRIWISAPVAESGNSMIATDLDGVKQWGTGMAHFGFDGPRKIAADERCAYAATPNMLFRVDPTRNFAARNIFTFPNQADMPWAPNHDPTTSGSGLAARDGKIYYAVSAPSSWLKPAFVSDDIDPLRCKPFVYLYKGHGQRKGRDDKSYDFYEYDELMLLYSAFCCEKTPAETPGIPNNPLSSNVRASFGEAPKSGPLRGSVVLTFRHPVTIGSVVVPDGAITVMAMKPGKVMPDTKGDVSAEAAANTGKLKKDDLEDNALLDDFKEGEGLSDDWVQLKTIGVPGKPAIAIAPEGGIKTAAIRYKVNRLKYSLVLAHRFEDVAQQAKRLYTEGKETPGGGWRTTRSDVAINDFRPAAMALGWTAKQSLRGITLERTPGGTDPEPIKIAIDAWIGEGFPTGPEALKQDASWKQIHYTQYNHSPMVHQMDFDGIVETAGLRVRFVNVKKSDNGNFEAGFDSIVAYHPVGGEAKDLPPDMTQRVSIFKLPPADDDKAPATVERHIPIAKPGDLAFDAAGTLYCVSAGQVVTVPLKEGEASRVVIAKDKLEAPLALSVGPDGLIYVGDNGPKVIKVFKPDSGELVKTLGTPGGLKPGKWDASKFNCPSGMAVDQKGRPWIADWCWAPKRIVRYSTDGKPEKEFLGPTQYGGGGTMDAKDRRLIYYAGMKFVIDWDARSWKLDSLMGAVVDRAFYVGERRYLMGPTPQDGRLATIAEEKDGVAKLMAQVGFLREWDAFKTSAELREKFGGLDLTNTLFVWSDLNGDRAPQANEVQTMIAPDNKTWTVGEDLTLLSRSHRIKPAKTLPDGVPVYDLKSIEKYNASVIEGHNDNPWGDDQGRIFMTGAKLIEASGKNLIWNYPNEFNKHDGFYASGFGYNRPPGVLNQEHSPIGHIKIGKEEFFITNSDEADWFCYTADGLLVGCIMGGPAGYGKKSWTMPQWEPGLDLSDLRPGQEHYQGCVVRTDDGKVYAVAGHNHMSIVRVDGLEQTQRLSGEFKVTDEHVEQTRQWALREAQKRQATEAPKAAKMLYSSGSPEIDGFHGDWPEELFVTVGETTIRGLKETRVVLDATAALAFDDKNLYVAMKVRDESPLKNSAEDVLTLFKTGDAAEVTLRTDPAAEKNVNVAAGDIRLLFAKVKNRPVAVLYKPVDPGAKPEVHREFSSPVGRVNMDRVEVLSTAKMSFDVKKLKDKIHDGTYWIMEASVPWASLGIKPPEIGAALRGDFGWLESDENGTQTIARHYWSGKAQTVISDLPSEARLNPSLWAAFSVVKPDAKLRIITQKKTMDANDLLKPDAGKELEELLK